MNEIMTGADIKKLMQKATAIQVYGDAKHRNMIDNVKRVIINHAYEDVSVEPEMLIITEKLIFRIIPDPKGDFKIRYSKLNETFDEFGQCLINRTDLEKHEKNWT